MIGRRGFFGAVGALVAAPSVPDVPAHLAGYQEMVKASAPASYRIAFHSPPQHGKSGAMLTVLSDDEVRARIQAALEGIMHKAHARVWIERRRG